METMRSDQYECKPKKFPLLHFIQKNLLWVVAAPFILWGCSSGNDLPVSDSPQMVKLAAPITVNLDSTVIELADYLARPLEIDSIDTDPALSAVITDDSARLVIRPLRQDFPGLSEMRIWSGGFPYSILLEKSAKVWFRFTFDPKTKKYRQISLKGQMNDWNPSKGRMLEKDGRWQIDLHLFPGRYQYKLVADGREMSDPGNPDSVPNGLGGFNSLLTLGQISSPNLPQLFTKSTDGRSLVIGLKNKADRIFVMWQNHVLDSSFWKTDSAGIRVTLPKKARDFRRSYLRAWAVNSTGISNQVLVPLEKGEVVDDPKQLTRADREAMILYFMMVDRFRNGNPDNDAPVSDPEIDPKVNYQGGDLAGITQTLEEGYFDSLGVNALWISPVTQNPLQGYTEYPAPHRKFSGYHGYWPITLTTVDARFGTSGDLKKLIGTVHDGDRNILLDFVSHHAHQDYPVFKTHPDWVTPLDLPGGRKNIRIWDEQRLTTWFDTFLPTFDLSKPEVAEMVSDSALFWVAEYGFDGFRHDAAKHIPENYWRMLTAKLGKSGHDVYQIGETFGSRDLIGSYVNPGMLDAQFEFNLYWDAKSAFATDSYSLRDLNYSLQQSFSYYGEHNLMGNITGNQDMARFISYASGALKFSENDVEAGWKRDIKVEDTIGYRRLALLQAFNMTVPGIPVIYYGDEFGMAGAGDPDNRRMMRFDSLNPHELALRSTTASLAKFRGSSLALTFGDFKTLKVNDKVWVYLRSYFGKAVVVIINKDREQKTVEFELPARFAGQPFSARYGGKPETADAKVRIVIPAVSFEILQN